MNYDFIIVGAGLFGSVFAYEAKNKGYKCLVLERRNHIAGNIYCEEKEGINVHKYGPHIFHTDDEAIWNYVNRFVEFNNFRYSPIANYKGRLYNLPFNMNTFNQIWGITEPKEAQRVIAQEIKEYGFKNPQNLEEQAMSLVGKTVYEKLIKGYTEKQWGRKATKIPSFIIKRLPIRYTFDNNYFNHRYQGIPIGGYNKIINKMLEGVEVRLETDYLKDKEYYDSIGDKIVYSGMIDEYFNYKYGRLNYRSLEFKSTVLNQKNYQGVAGMNFTDKETPYTRIIEHKHFEFGTQEKTIITKEYAREWEKGDEPYYPINDGKNNKLYNNYLELAKKEKKLILGGRLAEYKYYDMHDVIRRSLEIFEKEVGANSLNN